MYDLNQIPYDYTVEVRNRFKGLDLIDRVPDEVWMEVCDIVQETGINRKRNAKGKMAVYMCIPSFLGFPPIEVTTEHQVESPVVYSRCS